MKKTLLFLITAMFALLLSACGKGDVQAESTISGKPAKDGSSTVSGKEEASGGLISFDDSDGNPSTYKEHVADLWEQTKNVLSQDLKAGYTDEEYQNLGNELDAVWTNLQVHASLDHQSDVEAADEDTAYANLIGHIKDLINKEYGNWGIGTAEEREEKRDNLRDGGLERKITDLSEIVNGKDS